MGGIHEGQRTLGVVHAQGCGYTCRSEDNRCCTGTGVWDIHAGQKTLGVASWVHQSWFSEAGSLTGLELTEWRRLAGHQAPWINLTLLLQCWDYKHTSPHLTGFRSSFENVSSGRLN